jgi:transcriptional regulator with XRE-family HTH domain
VCPLNPLDSLRFLLLSELGKRNWSQRELATRSGISPQALHVFMTKAGADMKVSTLIDVAQALDLPPAFLLATPEERSRLKGEVQAPAIPPFMEGVSRQLEAVEKRLAAIERTKPPSDPEGNQLAQMLETLAQAVGADSAKAAAEAWDKKHPRHPEEKKSPGSKGSKKSG